MGEQLGAASQVFIHDFARHLGPIDFKHDQVRPPFEKPVENSGQLVRIRTVDKPFGGERRRYIASPEVRFSGFRFACDVVEVFHVVDEKGRRPVRV